MEKFEIYQNYHELHFDEYPILFIGLNQNREVIVGSFLYENDESLIYLQSIISHNYTSSFLSGNIPYLNLLSKANEIYVVKKDFNENVINYFKIEFKHINPDFLPLPTAFCPIQTSETTRVFEDKLNRFRIYKIIESKIYTEKTFNFLDIIPDIDIKIKMVERKIVKHNMYAKRVERKKQESYAFRGHSKSPFNSVKSKPNFCHASRVN